MAEGGGIQNTPKNKVTDKDAERDKKSSARADGIKDDRESKYPTRSLHEMNNDGNDNDSNIKNTQKEKQQMFLSFDFCESKKAISNSLHSDDGSPRNGATNCELTVDKQDDGNPSNKDEEGDVLKDPVGSNIAADENQGGKQQNLVGVLPKLNPDISKTTVSNVTDLGAEPKEGDPCLLAVKNQVSLACPGSSLVYHAEYPEGKNVLGVNVVPNIPRESAPKMRPGDEKVLVTPLQRTSLAKNLHSYGDTRLQKDPLSDNKSPPEEAADNNKHLNWNTEPKHDVARSSILFMDQNNSPSDASNSEKQRSQSRDQLSAAVMDSTAKDSSNILPTPTAAPSGGQNSKDCGVVPDVIAAASGNLSQYNAVSIHNEEPQSDDTVATSTSTIPKRLPELQPHSREDDSGISSDESHSGLSGSPMSSDPPAAASLVSPSHESSAHAPGTTEHEYYQSSTTLVGRPKAESGDDTLLTTVSIFGCSRLDATLQRTSLALPQWTAASAFAIRLLIQIGLLRQGLVGFVIHLPTFVHREVFPTPSGTDYNRGMVSYSVNEDRYLLEDPQDLSARGAVGRLPSVTSTSTSPSTTTTVTTVFATSTTTASRTYLDSFESATQTGRISTVPLTSQPQQESSTPAQPAAPWPAVRHRQPIFVPSLGRFVLLRWEFEVDGHVTMGHQNMTVNLADGEEFTDQTDVTSEEDTNGPLEFHFAADLQILDFNDDVSQNSSNTSGDREISLNELTQLSEHQLMRQIFQRSGWGQGPLDDPLCSVCRTQMVDIITFQCHHRVLCNVCVRTCRRCPRHGCPRPRIEFFYRFDMVDDDADSDAD
ncbi:uncharacterized protein [Littorina saxatilis]|uniref:uncharacterized protein n=1 Tax=Littorina saxatilis TaxID=31220 RepID=UPI0038B62811